MKAMILAGGFGTRLAEESDTRPKPMVEIGGRPILWHIMKLYEQHDITDFIICLGYKADYIKKFFLDYAATLSDFTVQVGTGAVEVHKQRSENWNVTLIDTGLHSMTGGRIKRALSYVEPGETFCMTYGDGLSDVDIGASIAYHRSHGKLCTTTAVTPPGRFGVLEINAQDEITDFREKIASDQYRINGGFFVLEPGVGEYIEGDDTIWEQGPMRQLAADRQMRAFNHDGFWQPMDTLRDKRTLEALWDSGTPPWRQP
ncbi:glucose-1-phosphate cytidylyltransferase [uncultured Tateyamaria sp.]|uniref:glucose-1-phosphate cytidylyltransferase n=1 Tax=uncultured Tateyamaria sp. TaxID=455651 RepID=UPI002617251F|nr:glucose-1-phosphate cytidylyltransferase [uncultured Tateyamaria sp.]